MPKLQLGALLGGAIIAGVLPLQAGTAPLAADGPIQQNYIASEMQKLTQRLGPHAEAGRNAPRGDGGGRPRHREEDGRPDAEGDPHGEAMGGGGKTRREDSVAIEGRSAANRESFRLAQMFSLSEAQRERIF
ncbi:MAG: hypothetical protein WDO13_19410 [Verrucomicrobiota bacterium]